MPTPTPSPTDVPGTVLDSLASVAGQNPWFVAVIGLLVLTALVRSARIAIHDGKRDPLRRFTRADKALLLDRAGHRCEHHGRIGGRCRSIDRLEADHVHPWSRGGSTHLSNGQILCGTHNQEKRAGIPWDRSLRRLAEKRAAYYPSHVDRAVVRKTRRDQRARADGSTTDGRHHPPTAPTARWIRRDRTRTRY